MQEAACPTSESGISEITNRMEPGQGQEETGNSPLREPLTCSGKRTLKGPGGQKEIIPALLSRAELEVTSMHPPAAPLFPILGTNTTALPLLELVTWKPCFPFSLIITPSPTCRQVLPIPSGLHPCSLHQLIPPSLQSLLCGPLPPSSHLSVSLCLYPPIRLSFHSSVCLSLSIFLSIYPSLSPLLHPSLSIHVSTPTAITPGKASSSLT